MRIKGITFDSIEIDFLGVQTFQSQLLRSGWLKFMNPNLAHQKTTYCGNYQFSARFAVFSKIGFFGG